MEIDELADTTAPTANPKISKKFLHKRIKEQMEFYFSDSNLSKDRFLKQEIQKSDNGFIDLSLFLKFNKISQLSTDINKLKKSINKSNLLELNENKNKIRRVVPFVEPEQVDIDKRTVYVENLPLNVYHELVKRVFSRFGNVAYVSLPKYKSTGQIKGFGFVEFDSEQGAENATKVLSESIDKMDAGKFPKYNKKITNLENKIYKTVMELGLSEDGLDDKLLENVDTQVYSSKSTTRHVADKKVKRKLSKINDSSDRIEEPKKKERKSDYDTDVHSETEGQTTSGLDTDTEALQETDLSKKKKKNRRKKHSSKTARKREIEEESILLNMKVISKNNWLSLKEEYLRKQKENFAKLKEKLKSINQKQTEKVNENSQMAALNSKESDTKTTHTNISASGSIIKLVPKNILNDAEQFETMFKLSQQRFRDEFLESVNDDIAYVEMDKNTYKIFIRCKNNAKTKAILHNIQNLNVSKPFNMNILEGNEEVEYLNRIDSNRNKLQLKKEKKLRGKSKIAKKSYDSLRKHDDISNEVSKTKQERVVDSNQVAKKQHIKFDEE